MWPTLLGLIAAGAAALYWFAAAAARELARSHAQAVCARAQVQLLDGSVVLRRIRVRRMAEGLRLERRFAFEFSPDGAARVRGYIDLLGRDLQSATLPFSAGGPT